jgi:hypothetical protein
MGAGMIRVVLPLSMARTARCAKADALIKKGMG